MDNFANGETIHVPSKKVGLGVNYPSAMVSCRFVRKDGSLGIVDNIPYIDGEKKIALRLISRKLDFMIIQIGDFETEEILLEPLYDTVIRTTQLVLMPEHVWQYRIRSTVELEKIWSIRGSLLSHLVLIGHGSKNGLRVGENNANATMFLESLQKEPQRGQAPIIISLCCNTGNGFFGKRVSGSPLCRAFIGPGGSIHAANAALFYQSFLSHSLIDGLTIEKAYQKARVFTPGVTEFNMWKKTKLTHKPNRRTVLGHNDR